jgi:hypothetical protein
VGGGEREIKKRTEQEQTIEGTFASCTVCLSQTHLGTRRGCNCRVAAHMSLNRDEVESLDDARGRPLLVSPTVPVGVVVPLLLVGEPPNAPSVSAAESGGLRWPRREVSGY